MRAPHILTFARHLRGGGVERAQLRLAAGWLAQGRRVTLVVGRMTGPLVDELPPGIDLVAASGEGSIPLHTLPSHVRRHAPDVVFCAGNTYTSTAAWVRLRLGAACPLIVGKMSNNSRRVDLGLIGGTAYRSWLRLHGRFLDHLVAMTPETAERAARALGMEGRVSVIPNPPVPIVPGGARVALPAGRYILGVGRLVAQKRWDRLIAAVPHLSDPDVSLVIVGEGDRRPMLEAQIAMLGLQNRIFLPGHSGDPLPAMAGATLVALPSDFEGVPGVLREALSVGTPVVATESSPAIGEIVTSAALGSVVATDDAAALIAALEHWLHPAAVRPAPVPQPGHDSATRYLALFDALVEERALSAATPPRTHPGAPIAVPAQP